MLEQIILCTALFFIYFHVGGLATTNIIRLTEGNTLPVLSSKCVCDNCGTRIPAHLQLPVISFIICRGKCRNCGKHIPVYPLILELAIMLGMFIISIGFKLSLTGVCISFLYYEIVRIVTIAIRGKRKDGFCRNYIIAVISMIPFFVLTSFVSLVYSLVIF